MFTIPLTDRVGDDGASFTARSGYVLYHLYTDDWPHSRLRYSQLECLHQQLCRHFGNDAKALGVQFPAKSLLRLNDEAVKLRSQQLENYLNQLLKQLRILRSHVFCGFMVSAQLESWKLDDCADANSVSTAAAGAAAAARGDPVLLHVLLANGTQCLLSVAPDLHTDAVLELLGKEIRLPAELTFHFSLFLARAAEPNTADRPALNLLRQLHNFEAPYLSLCAGARRLKIECDPAERDFAARTVEADSRACLKLVLLKTSWNISYEQYLCSDPVALDLLYAQRVSEWQQQWIDTDDDTSRQLSLLQARGDKLAFLERARDLRSYGHMQFDRCACSESNKDCVPRPVQVSLGLNGLVIRPCDSVSETSGVSQCADSQGAASHAGRLTSGERWYNLTHIRQMRPKFLFRRSAAGKHGDSDMATVGSSSTSEESASTSAATDKRQPKQLHAVMELDVEYIVAGNSPVLITLQSYQALLMFHSLHLLLEDIFLAESGAPHANRLCPGVLRPCDKLYRTDYQYLSRTGRLTSLQLPSKAAASSTATEGKVLRSCDNSSPVLEYSDLMRKCTITCHSFIDESVV